MKFIGRLADGWIFAGRPLRDALPGGGLWRCNQCFFAFRDPLLTDQTYETLYRNGALDVWDGEQPREDFKMIRESLLASVTEGLATAAKNRPEVLDVGCYTGQFLTSLPSSWRTYGIEANKEAAKIASSKGIEVIAATLREFSTMEGSYDVITACDVIEHLPNPVEFLAQLRKHLKPGGIILITTGNCDAWLWRLSKARFWYCNFPEHISFIGRRWIRKMPQAAGLQLATFSAFNYVGGSARLRRLMTTMAYIASPLFYSWFRTAAGKGTRRVNPPGNGATKDHMLCIFKAV